MIRDPRAVYLSMLAEPEYWKHVIKDVGAFCAKIEEDINMGELMKEGRLDARKLYTLQKTLVPVFLIQIPSSVVRRLGGHYTGDVKGGI